MVRRLKAIDIWADRLFDVLQNINKQNIGVYCPELEDSDLVKVAPIMLDGIEGITLIFTRPDFGEVPIGMPIPRVEFNWTTMVVEEKLYESEN